MKKQQWNETLTRLEKLHPCPDALSWAGKQKSAADAWKNCKRGDWMLWILEQTGADRKQITLAACECARLALKFVGNDIRPRLAIETAEAWAHGKATLKQVRAANNAASATLAAYAPTGTSFAAACASNAAACASNGDNAAVYAAKQFTLAVCADIVRKYFPSPPKL